MKNTIKGDYERKVQEDGSIVLEFTACRFKFGLYGIIFSVIIFAIAIGVIMALNANDLMMAIIVFCGGMYGTKLLLLYKQKIIIIPNEGIKFRGESIPFSAISTIGVRTWIGKQKGTLFVTSGGRNVDVAWCRKHYLADALKDEIESASGINWN